MKLKIAKIAEFISAPPTTSEQVVGGYSIDSRSIQVGELFFAVKGERLDGQPRLFGGGNQVEKEQLAFWQLGQNGRRV